MAVTKIVPTAPGNRMTTISVSGRLVLRMPQRLPARRRNGVIDQWRMGLVVVASVVLVACGVKFESACRRCGNTVVKLRPAIRTATSRAAAVIKWNTPSMLKRPIRFAPTSGPTIDLRAQVQARATGRNSVTEVLQVMLLNNINAKQPANQ